MAIIKIHDDVFRDYPNVLSLLAKELDSIEEIQRDDSEARKFRVMKSGVLPTDDTKVTPTAVAKKGVLLGFIWSDKKIV